jgi:hypothetical protein
MRSPSSLALRPLGTASRPYSRRENGGSILSYQCGDRSKPACRVHDDLLKHNSPTAPRASEKTLYDEGLSFSINEQEHRWPQ